VSRAAIELIKRFEGFRETAAQLPDGRWTIGHGHTLTARQGARVSADDAEALLLYDLIGVAHALNEQVFAPLTQNQFDALASFAFNLGLDNFARSGVLKRLNEGSPIMAACAMELWRKAEVGGERIVVDALVRRRAAEKALFLTPEGGVWVPAPSPILKPLMDAEALDLMPLHTPAGVAVGLEGESVTLTREGEPPPPLVEPDEDAEDEGQGPTKSAAEAVTARLSTIFQEPGEAPPAPEVDAAPDVTVEPPFTLQPPEFAAEPEAEAPAETEDEGPRGPDLFETPVEVVETATEPEPAAELEPSPPQFPPAREPQFNYGADDPDDRPPIPARRVIDDAAPFDLDSEEMIVQPLPEQPEGGALAVVMLGGLGLVFFGGGAFWAFSARPSPSSSWLDPRMVGLLAGIAGALFISVAVYLLLQRLGQASERAARNRR
jgi:lysozyme